MLAALHPLGRAGTPAEVAEVVAALLGPAGTVVSGATIPVDGGLAAAGPARPDDVADHLAADLRHQ